MLTSHLSDKALLRNSAGRLVWFVFDVAALAIALAGFGGQGLWNHPAITTMLLLPSLLRLAVDPGVSRPAFVRLANLLVIGALTAALFFRDGTVWTALSAVRLFWVYPFADNIGAHFRSPRLTMRMAFRGADYIAFVSVSSAMVLIDNGGADGALRPEDAWYYTICGTLTLGQEAVIPRLPHGHMLAMIISLAGVLLAARFLAASFGRSGTNRMVCNSCGMTRHESDAAYCIHCGNGLARSK